VWLNDEELQTLALSRVWLATKLATHHVTSILPFTVRLSAMPLNN